MTSSPWPGRWPLRRCVSDPDLVGLFIAPLERVGPRYMITGGVAAVIYGDPRFTRDIDVVLELDREVLADVATAFEGGNFSVPPEEVLQEEVARADVYLMGNDPLHAWAMARRRRIAVGEISIWLAPIGYVIVRKLEYYRSSGSDRHLRDVAVMLEVSGALVEDEELREWAGRRGVAEALEEAERFEMD